MDYDRKCVAVVRGAVVGVVDVMELPLIILQSALYLLSVSFLRGSINFIYSISYNFDVGNIYLTALKLYTFCQSSDSRLTAYTVSQTVEWKPRFVCDVFPEQNLTQIKYCKPH